RSPVQSRRAAFMNGLRVNAGLRPRRSYRRRSTFVLQLHTATRARGLIRRVDHLQHAQSIKGRYGRLAVLSDGVDEVLDDLEEPLVPPIDALALRQIHGHLALRRLAPLTALRVESRRAHLPARAPLAAPHSQPCLGSAANGFQIAHVHVPYGPVRE